MSASRYPFVGRQFWDLVGAGMSPSDALGHDLRLAQALQRVEDIAGALHPNSGIEQRIRRQVFQIVGKVRQLIHKDVGRKPANSAREGRAIKDVADDRLSADGGQPASLLGRSLHRADGVPSAEKQWYQPASDDTGSTCEVDAHAATPTADWPGFVGHFGASSWANLP